MKTCVITDEISSDPETAIDLALEWGIRHFEIRSLWGRRVPDIQVSQHEQLRKILTQCSIEVAALSPGIFKVNVNDEASVKNHLTYRPPAPLSWPRALEVI